MKKIIYALFLLIVVVGCSHNKPKNVIIMISDGCGYNHILATDYYQYGESGKQVYQQFPVQQFMTTYSLNVLSGYDSAKAWSDSTYIGDKWTDSAASATAMSTGIKTRNTIIGKDSTLVDVEHFSEFMQKQGKKIGVATNVLASHATPAGFSSHNIYRKNYAEIFKDMVTDSYLSVIIGGGLNDYDELAYDKKYKYVGGKEFWQQIMEGQTKYDLDNDGYVDRTIKDINYDLEPDVWEVVREREDFVNINPDNAPERLLGIFQSRKNAQYDRDGEKNVPPFTVPFRENIPTLAEMAMASIYTLDNDNGFWLMVEGGAVDKASHAKWNGRVIEEEIDFNKAVEAVVEWVETNSSWDETLLIVTADHECGHISGEPNMTNEVVADVKNRGKGNMPEMYNLSGQHTNSLVPFFAKGIGAENFLKKAIYTDLKHGKYMDNTEMAKTLFELFGK